MDKEKVTETQKRAKAVYDGLKDSILTKIPALNGKDSIYLPMIYFKKLTDEEFVVLWTLPGITIHVSYKTGQYIDDRRKILGLKKKPGSSVKPGT